MPFQGPAPEDLDNVASLNRVFLDLLPRHAAALGVPDRLRDEFAALETPERRRLADSPFLLFTVGEADEARWERLFDGRRCHDLVDRMSRPPVEIARLTAAAVGFLWQLAARNAYAVRVISGAPQTWCHRLAESTLVDVVEYVAAEGALLKLRFAGDALFWHRLLVAGTSDKQAVRRAARLSALQALLATRAVERQRRLPAAACPIPESTLRVAERTLR